MYILYLAEALIIYTVTYTVYQVLFSHLHAVPGPLLARWTRLWQFLEVLKGRFEKTNLELHKRYGRLSVPRSHTL
jgi:hypothetical protein